VKRSRLLAIAAVALAAGGSTFLASGTASADAPSTTEWVNTTAQLTATTDDQFTGSGWGIETYTDTDPTTAATFGPSGLSVDGTQPVVIGHVTDVPATSLVADVEASSIVSSGVARPIFEIKDANGTDVYLQAITSGADALAADATYVSYQNVDGSIGYTSQTLQQWQDAFTASEPDATVIVYGAILAAEFTNPTLTTPSLSTGDDLLPGATPDAQPTAPATVSAIDFNDLTTYFTPTPPAALTVSPATTTESGFGTGVTVSGSGFFPGETVSTGYALGEAGNDLPTTFVADANGNVSGNLPGPATIVAGTYNLVLIGETSGIAEAGTLVVTADPAVAQPATPVRAAATFTG
jgi:hypothetical protein